MCEITKKLCDDARMEGRESGLREGEFGMLFKLIDKGVLTPAVAAESIGVDEAELMERMKALS